jgi:hypothetical protein
LTAALPFRKSGSILLYEWNLKYAQAKKSGQGHRQALSEVDTYCEMPHPPSLGRNDGAMLLRPVASGLYGK